MRCMVELEILQKRFGPLTAVEDVSFSVNQGEVLGFLGLDCAGMFATMKMVTGLPASAAGLVAACGHAHRLRILRHLSLHQWCLYLLSRKLPPPVTVPVLHPGAGHAPVGEGAQKRYRGAATDAAGDHDAGCAGRVPGGQGRHGHGRGPDLPHGAGLLQRLTAQGHYRRRKLVQLHHAFGLYHQGGHRCPRPDHLAVPDGPVPVRQRIPAEAQEGGLT